MVTIKVGPRAGKVLQEVIDRLEERKELYDVEPVNLLTDQELIAVMKMKLYRVQFGKNPEKTMDDLLDLIAYALKLALRWLNE